MSRFKKFSKKHGEPSNCEAVPQKSLELYANKLPAELLEEWQQSGWCSYGNGFLWTINPAEYMDVLEDWVESTEGLHPFLRTAFGDIFYWDGQDTQYLDVQEGDTTVVFRRMEMLFDGMLCDDKSLNDLLQHKTFKLALPRLGPPTKDEVYAFVPPVAMGGSGELDTLKRYKLREHLTILAQLVGHEDDA
ncbi:GAD-like domain-containing protein [Pyxidicoccus sp. 3LFB2]